MIKPIHSSIIVKLPSYQGEGVRKSQGGLFIPHLREKIEHDSSCGEVVAVADNCTICKVGDTVWFDYYSVNAGLQNSGRDVTRHHGTKDTAPTVPIYLIENSYVDDVPELPKGLYLIFPETRIAQQIIAKDSLEEKAIGGASIEIPQHLGVICLMRNGEIHTCNGYYLLQAVNNAELVDGRWIKKSGLIDVVQLGKEENKARRYEILYAPDDGKYKKGDIVFTEPNIEIKLEGLYNYPQFPENTFYAESSLILGKMEDFENEVKQFSASCSA